MPSPGASELAGLPGASPDPGSGTVVETLVDGLLADVVPAPPDAAVTIARPVVADALSVHRDHRSAWYGDLLGPLRVPAASVADLVPVLTSREHALPVTLVPSASPAGDPLAELHAARALLIDDDRVEVVGVELPLPAGADPAGAARAALSVLDLSVPVFFVVPADPAWLPALPVLAEDGAESVALHVTPAAVAGAAAVLRAAVDLDLPVAVTSGTLPAVTDPSGCGVLNLLCAVRAALNGAAEAEVAAVLAATSDAPLASATRRMSDADAAVVRAFLPALTTPSVRDTVEALASMGLIAPDAA